MSLNADTLLDRIYLKAQARKWRIIGVIAVLAAVIISLPHVRDNKMNPLPHPYIARITIEGIIDDDPKLDELIEEVKEDDDVVAVILRLDTPGGSAVGGEELYLNLRDLSKTKPVVAVMRSMATSAGYMAAIGADHIVAREGTITGSIGVIVQSGEVTNLIEKIGITPITVKSAPLKGSPSMFEKNTPESQQVLQDVVNDFYARFVDMVTERRKLPRAEVVKLADGRVYSGRAALKFKLIDQLGGEKEALDWLAKQKKIDIEIGVEDVEKKKEKSSFLQEIKGMATGTIFENMLVKLDGLVLIWHPNIL